MIAHAIGDVDRRGDDIAGTTVNVASRAMDAAGPREVLVTSNARGHPLRRVQGRMSSVSLACCARSSAFQSPLQ